ncbi:MAG: PD-(D/E)XK nuclease family transposase [Planctomycetaceae bacterium]
MPKFPAGRNAVVTPLDQWLFFLRNALGMDSEHVPPYLTLPTIHKAIDELHMISVNEADHELYLSRRKYLLDEQSRREEGLEEGLSKGVIQGRIQMLESLLGLAHRRLLSSNRKPRTNCCASKRS